MLKQSSSAFEFSLWGEQIAAKTTLLRKVYNATGKPEIFDGKGNEVDHPTSALPTD
jgi:hypothetical protein